MKYLRKFQPNEIWILCKRTVGVWEDDVGALATQLQAGPLQV